MKKIIFLILITLFLIACGKSSKEENTELEDYKKMINEFIEFSKNEKRSQNDVLNGIYLKKENQLSFYSITKLEEIVEEDSNILNFIIDINSADLIKSYIVHLNKAIIFDIYEGTNDFNLIEKYTNANNTIGILTIVYSMEYKENVYANGDFIENQNGSLYVAGHIVAKENILRAIPTEYINYARNNFKIAYQHTSHGTHLSKGMFGLQDFKNGDNILLGITNNNPTANKLDFRDYAIENYAAPGKDASDLSRDETAFIQATRNYLDAPGNSEINVVVWSWCSITGHDVTENYLKGMQTLINEYGEGGSKVGLTRSVPVIFIFMTGHAETYNLGSSRPKNQADLINQYCEQNNYFCLDYYDIDTHDMEDNYWEDADDNGYSASYGGNFYQNWQTLHNLGQDWYENKNTPSGYAEYGEHNSQHITANRKAFAFWWILARAAGWNGR